MPPQEPFDSLSSSSTPPGDAALPVIGWREHVALPDFGIRSIEARIDTGAKTSSLHAVDLEEAKSEDATILRFSVPVSGTRFECTAPLVENRRIRSSNGEATVRPVVKLRIRLAGVEFPIEVTLADRSGMRFPMLIGRTSLRSRFLVDVASSFAGG